MKSIITATTTTTILIAYGLIVSILLASSSCFCLHTTKGSLSARVGRSSEGSSKVVEELSPRSTEDLYDEYKLHFNKDDRVKIVRNVNSKEFDDSQEERLRFELFKESREFVEAFNQMPNRSHDLELNELADWTQDELDSLNGYKKSMRISNPTTKSFSESEEENIPFISGDELERHIPGFLTNELPEDKDWRLVEGVVGPPGNQGNCGSCWAFSIVGMLEGQERKLNNTLRSIVQLSQQQLVDCNLEDRGCSGGRFITALGYIERAGGLQTYRDYPYESGTSGNNTQCRFDETKAFPSTKYLSGTRRLQSGDEELLKRVVAHYGPVSVAVDSTHKEFRLYSKGIHYNPNCTTLFNHSMLIVGYGKSSSGQDYWIVRNSWGKRWGMGGYILMARNRGNNCGIASNPVLSLANFPDIDKDSHNSHDKS